MTTYAAAIASSEAQRLWGARTACEHEWGGEWEPRWITLAPFWDWIAHVAAERDADKHDLASSRYWNVDSHRIGLLGELVYGLTTGRSVDVVTRIGAGDSGRDFASLVDIKTSTFPDDPWLKHPQRSRRWAPWFALVALDEERKRGKLVGMVTSRAVFEAPIRDWGHGPQHSLRGRDMRLVVPENVCRRCGGRRSGY